MFVSFLESQTQLSNLNLEGCKLDASTSEAVLTAICQSDCLQTMQELKMYGSDLSSEGCHTSLANILATAIKLNTIDI